MLYIIKCIKINNAIKYKMHIQSILNTNKYSKASELGHITFVDI